LDTIQHNPARLYNCDETGITVVQHKHTKILGSKGVTYLRSNPQNGDLLWQSSPVWVQLDTSFLRFLYFQEKIWNKNWWMAWTGSIHTCHPSGWIQSEIFSQWFLHFIKHTKPTKEDTVILVLDRHYSHARNWEVITLARENHVDIICLPPHSSHKMHPLDKAFMEPLRTFYCQEIEKWLPSHPGRVITVY